MGMADHDNQCRLPAASSFSLFISAKIVIADFILFFSSAASVSGNCSLSEKRLSNWGECVGILSFCVCVSSGVIDSLVCCSVGTSRAEKITKISHHCYVSRCRN